MNIEATDSRTTIWYWPSRKLPLVIGGNGSTSDTSPNRRNVKVQIWATHQAMHRRSPMNRDPDNLIDSGVRFVYHGSPVKRVRRFLSPMRDTNHAQQPHSGR